MLMLKLAVLAVSLFIIVATATAAPLTGNFASQELGGQILDGRWSESFIGGNPDTTGNTIHAASYDANTAVLGGQWDLSSASQVSASQLLSTAYVGGLTIETYQATFTGGKFYLKDTGPWWNPADSGTQYTVDLSNNCLLLVTNTMLGNTTLATTVNIQMTGTFEGFPDYQLAFATAVAVPTGYGTALPSGFPALQPNTATAGQWGVIQKIRMETVPEPATVAILLAGGAVSAIRRKRR